MGSRTEYNNVFQPPSCSCGNILDDESRFCRKCGTLSELVSDETPGEDEIKCNCGMICTVDANFCKRCGRRRPRADAKKHTRKVPKRDPKEVASDAEDTLTASKQMTSAVEHLAAQQQQAAKKVQEERAEL